MKIELPNRLINSLIVEFLFTLSDVAASSKRLPIQVDFFFQNLTSLTAAVVEPTKALQRYYKLNHPPY